jgi:hypothetical protein
MTDPPLKCSQSVEGVAHFAPQACSSRGRVHELSAQSAPDSIRVCSRRLRMACGVGKTLLRCAGIRADFAIPTGPEWQEQRPGEAVCLNQELRNQAQQQAPALAKAQATLRAPRRPSSCPQAHVTAPSTKRALYNLRPHISGSCAATQQRDACSSVCGQQAARSGVAASVGLPDLLAQRATTIETSTVRDRISRNRSHVDLALLYACHLHAVSAHQLRSRQKGVHQC